MHIIFCILVSILSVYGKVEQVYLEPKDVSLEKLPGVEIDESKLEIVGVGNNVPVSDDDRIAKLERVVDTMKKTMWIFDTEKCPKSYIWDKTLKFCYKVHAEDVVNWHVAMLICRTETPGGRLVILDSEEKRLAVRKTIMSSTTQTRNYFVGSKRTASDGNFYWIDGQKMEKVAWCDGEPNGTNCGNLWGKEGYCVDDVHCKSLQTFVCEKPME